MPALFQAVDQVATTQPSPGKSGVRLRASVIIVAYNNHADLENCLPSITTHMRPEDEIILVDNNSTDESVAYVSAAFPDIHIIRNDKNLGFAAGSNSGAAQAGGEYLAFLNPDTIVSPGWLDALIAALQDNPRAGLATAKILLLNDPERINAAGNTIHLSGITQCRGLERRSDDLSQPGQVPAVSGAAFAIRRDLFESLGGFDSEFFMYVEDTDLSWRARLAGKDCLYAPASVVYHDYSLRFGIRKIYYQERNRYMMLLKSLRWPTLLALSPALFLAEVVTWGFVLLHNQEQLKNKNLSKNSAGGCLIVGGYPQPNTPTDNFRMSSKFSAYRWIVKHWSHIMEARLLTQQQRQVPDRRLLKQTGFRLTFDQVDKGWVGSLARLIFDPAFFLLRLLALALVWW